MRVITNEHQVSDEVGKQGIGFVPTMGALHEGHLSLVRASKAESDMTVVSIFVNPLQFGPNEDLSSYPRPIEKDCALLEAEGVDFLFLPSADEFYDGMVTKVSVSGLSELWEGKHRPGHFDGVATVVCKLFQIVGPDRAYFGLKDFQQCAVISKMTKDLSIPVDLRFLPTIRESDGLAMSSRNAYLSSEERVLASSFARTLMSAKMSLEECRINSLACQELLNSSAQLLKDLGFLVDYFSLVDQQTLEPVNDLNVPRQLIAAVRIGRTRLIDNVEVGAELLR